MLDAGACPRAVVGEDAIRGQARRRPVEEHDRRAGAQLRHEVAVVPARGDDQHRVHATPQQRGDQLALELGILLARARDQQVAARASRLLHGLGDGGVEGIRDVLDDQAERGGGATMAQAPREVVALKAEGGNRGDHARGGLVRDAGLVVYHARDGLQAHAGFFGNIPHRWPRRSQSHLTLVLMTTLSDNVVSSEREYASPDVCQVPSAAATWVASDPARATSTPPASGDSTLADPTPTAYATAAGRSAPSARHETSAAVKASPAPMGLRTVTAGAGTQPATSPPAAANAAPAAAAVTTAACAPASTSSRAPARARSRASGTASTASCPCERPSRASASARFGTTTPAPATTASRSAAPLESTAPVQRASLARATSSAYPPSGVPGGTLPEHTRARAPRSCSATRRRYVSQSPSASGGPGSFKTVVRPLASMTMAVERSSPPQGTATRSIRSSASSAAAARPVCPGTKATSVAGSPRP